MGPVGSKPEARARIEKIQAVLERQALDAVVLVPGSNFRYLTGSVHHLMERPILLFVRRDGISAVVLPKLELAHFQAGALDPHIFSWSDADGYVPALSKAASLLELAGGRVGVEGQTMRYFEVLGLQKSIPNVRVVDCHAEMSSIRAVKGPSEIASLRKAVEIAERAFEQTLGQISAGLTERAVLDILKRQLYDAGSGPLAFEPIVLAGKNTANPHGHVRDDYKIEAGDPLLFDFGASSDGYSSDMTRTVFLGSASKRIREIYEVVLAANRRGREIAKPGQPARDVDASVTQVLIDRGFESLVLHRTGHGLGLDVHEAPYLSKDNAAPLEEGNVVTIEPGLYDPVAGGVRIEDDVLITEHGCESLTSLSRELMVLPG